MMVGTSTLAIMECELKEALILLWHGTFLIGMAPVSKTITQALRLFLILIRQACWSLLPTDSQIFGEKELSLEQLKVEWALESDGEED